MIYKLNMLYQKGILVISKQISKLFFSYDIKHQFFFSTIFK